MLRARTSNPRRWLVLATAALVLAACGDDGSSTATTTTTTPTPSTTDAPVTGCTGDGSVPSGATTQEIADVDGDGRADAAYLAGVPVDLVYGIVTAAGGEATSPFESASPVSRRALAVNADERGPVEVLLSDGRSVQLLAFVDCELVAVQGPDGEPYVFDRGFVGTGTGVGCVDGDGDGQRDLVGLRRLPGDGAVVRWTRTVVELDGARATHGPTEEGTFDPATDAEAIDLLTDVTCGERTLADGLSARDITR